MKKQRRRSNYEHIHLFVAPEYAEVFRTAAASRDLPIKRLFEMLVAKSLSNETPEFAKFLELEGGKLKV